MNAEGFHRWLPALGELCKGLLEKAPSHTQSEIDYSVLVAKKNSLVSSIAVEKDATQIVLLKGDLKATEISIAELKSEIDLQNYNYRNYRLLEAAQAYQSATNILLTSLSQNQQCLMKHPSLAETIGTFGLALAQSGTLALSTGGASVLAGAGIYTVARVTEFIKDKKNQKYLKRITAPALVSAMSCAMEKLNEIYCESEGIEKLGTFVLSPQYRIFKSTKNEAFEGLELIEEALPVLDDVLKDIKSGTAPASGMDGMQKAEISTLETFLKNSNIYFDAFFNDFRRNVLAIEVDKPTQERREEIFSEQKVFIERFMISVGIYPSNSQMSGSTNSPLAIDSYKGDAARYYLMGFNLKKMKFSGLSSAAPFSDLKIEGSYEGDDPWINYSGEDTHFYEDVDQFYSRVKERFDKWFNVAQSRLDTQAKQILKSDKKEILAGFDVNVPGHSQTPLVFLEEIANFISSPTNQRYLSRRQRIIAEEVTTVLDNIVYNISGISFDLPDDEFQKQVDKVFKEILKETKYSEQSRYIDTRLKSLINSIVLKASVDLYKNGNKDMIYALASSDVVKELKSFAGNKKSTIDLINDAKKTKGQVIPVFSAFVDAFRETIENHLVELARPENRIRRAQERGLLCLQLLGLDQNFKTGFFSKDFIKKVIIPNCEGATIPQVAIGTPPAPVVTRQLWSLPTEERICLHQNWRRKLSIFEKGIER